MSDPDSRNTSPKTRTQHNQGYLPSWVDDDPDVDHAYAWCPTCYWASEEWGFIGNALKDAKNHHEYGSYPDCYRAKTFAVLSDDTEVEIV